MPEPSPGGSRWHRIDSLFDAALDLPPDDRLDFLQRECGDDDDLFQSVEELLAAAQRTHPLLDHRNTHLKGLTEDAIAHASSARGVPDGSDDSAAATSDPEPLPADLAGMRVGPFELVREVGRGGMGAVWLARRVDGEFEQDVAIKFISPGLETDLVLERFREERQILASLHHPNIASLLDGGTTDYGAPYLVMEYVDGAPITTWCTQRGAGLRERLQLFATVGRAVRYAHAKLVVHRDIKPSNVLIDGSGRVKLLDFGVARILSDQDAAGSAPTPRPAFMTPAYASPEQIRRERVTTSSDVYQLGLLLYELLAAAPPYTGEDGTLDSLEQAILETDPPAPSQNSLPRLKIPFDLDRIVLKSLFKEPDARYESVERMVEDVERYLTDLPVRAAGGSWRYRTGKFLRRNGWRVAAAALAVVSTVGYAATLAVQADRLEAERDRAEFAARTSNSVVDFMVGLFDASDPAYGSGLDAPVGTVLETGVSALDTELEDQPEVQARLLSSLGAVYRNLGAYDRAEPLLQRSVALSRQSRDVDPRHLAESLDNLAWLDKELGNSAPAERTYREALAIYRSLGDEREAATTANNLAILLQNLGRLDEAEPLYREALAVRRERADTANLGTSLNSLGFLLHHRGEFDEATALYEQAVQHQRRHGSGFMVAAALNNLAGLHLDTERFAEAEAAYREVLDLLLEEFDESNQYVQATRGGLASAISAQGRHDEALEIANAALASVQRTLPENHTRIGTAHRRVAGILREMGRLNRAVVHLRRALEIQTISAPDAYQRARWARALAGVLMDQSEYAEAEFLLLDAHAQLTSEYPDRTGDIQAVRADLERLYGDLGRPQAAARYAAPYRGDSTGSR